MLIRIRFGKDSANETPWRTGHKPLSLLYSLAFHGSLVALAFLPSPFSDSDSLSRATVVELEKDHKIIYYDFRKELPEVSAANPSGKITTPSPQARKSRQRIVAAPLEKPGKQLVYLPEPHIKLQTDLTAPNLIAIEQPVTVPLPERPKLKTFQAPEAPKLVAPPVAPLPSAPALTAEANPKDPALNALLNKPVPKPFLTPVKIVTTAVAAPATLPNAPALAPNDKNSALPDVLNKPAAAPLKQFTPPARTNALKPAEPASLPNGPAVAAVANENNSAIDSLLKEPSGPPLKHFNAPPVKTSVAGSTPAPLPGAPAVDSNPGDKNTAISALLNKPSGPLKSFTPPPAKVGGAAAGPTPVLPGAPAVAAASGDKQLAIDGLLNKPAAPLKTFRAPPSAANASPAAAPAAALAAPPPVAGGGQPATATVAILGLNPANVPQIPKPEGSRPARIEAGTPVPGATRAETGGGNGPISVPDISIQGGQPNSPSTATREPLDRSAQPAVTGLARPQMPRVLPTTPHVSVPQWPNTRTLPVAVERHFQNRVVYTTLIPGMESGDDWVVWFAETAVSPPEPNLLMHPPTLMKSGVLPVVPATSDHGTGSIRLTGVIRKDGHLGSVTDLNGAPADRELAEALQGWQFGPARRNGVIIDADAIIEIPVVFGKLSLR